MPNYGAVRRWRHARFWMARRGRLKLAHQRLLRVIISLNRGMGIRASSLVERKTKKKQCLIAGYAAENAHNHDGMGRNLPSVNVNISHTGLTKTWKHETIKQNIKECFKIIWKKNELKKKLILFIRSIWMGMKRVFSWFWWFSVTN